MQELSEDTPWAPRMDAIRQAQLAGTAALEEVFEALGSKQHSSIIELRKQMDAMMAWKMKVTGKDRELAARREAAKDSTATKASATTKEMPGGDSGISTPSVAAVEESVDQSEAQSLAINLEYSEGWGGSFDEPIERGMGVFLL